MINYEQIKKELVREMTLPHSELGTFAELLARLNFVQEEQRTNEYLLSLDHADHSFFLLGL